MKILLFGATGRVGEAVSQIVLEKGHALTILVRNNSKVKLANDNLRIVEVDIYNYGILQELANENFDVIINVVGADPLKPSTLVTDAATTLSQVFAGKQARYLAITGIAQMKKTWFGTISNSILKLTPVKHAIKDHQNAFDIINTSKLNWCLIGCPYIKDGPTIGKFKTADFFPGGFKIIHPGDVAIAITNQIDTKVTKKIIGIWY